MAFQTTMQFRIDNDVKKAFEKRCSEFHIDHTDMARDLVQAFAEGRVTISKSETQKKKEELYHD